MRVSRDDEDVVIVPRRPDGSLMTVFEALDHPANVSRRDRQQAAAREALESVLRMLHGEAPDGATVIYGVAPEEDQHPS